MKRVLCAFGLMTVLILTGCEWESTGSSGSWNSDYNWVNFDGVYRAPDGGILVRSFTTTPGSDPFQQPVSGEGLGTGVPAQTAYSGNLNNTPIVPGTVTIQAGGFFFTDDGSGGLSGTGGKTGTIQYDTGAWSIDLGVDTIPGQPLTASYVYTAAGADATVNPGNTGTPIYSLTVFQEGNLISLTASDGTVFSGNMGSVRSTVGDLQELPVAEDEQAGVIVGQFEVAAESGIRIVGTLQGTLQQEEADYALFDRQMNATWIEPNGTTADITGVAGSVGVNLPEPQFDDRPDPDEGETT